MTKVYYISSREPAGAFCHVYTYLRVQETNNSRIYAIELLIRTHPITHIQQEFIRVRVSSEYVNIDVLKDAGRQVSIATVEETNVSTDTDENPTTPFLYSYLRKPSLSNFRVLMPSLVQTIWAYLLKQVHHLQATTPTTLIPRNSYWFASLKTLLAG